MPYKINNKEELETFVCKNWEMINAYINQTSNDLPIPFYSSVDIRESKLRVCPSRPQHVSCWI